MALKKEEGFRTSEDEEHRAGREDDRKRRKLKGGVGAQRTSPFQEMGGLEFSPVKGTRLMSLTCTLQIYTLKTLITL